MATIPRSNTFIEKGWKLCFACLFATRFPGVISLAGSKGCWILIVSNGRGAAGWVCKKVCDMWRCRIVLDLQWIICRFLLTNFFGQLMKSPGSIEQLKCQYKCYFKQENCHETDERLKISCSPRRWDSKMWRFGVIPQFFLACNLRRHVNSSI